jgi:hypothetical protein
MSGAITSTPPYAFTAWTKAALHLRSKGKADAVALFGDTAHKSSAGKYTEREGQLGSSLWIPQRGYRKLGIQITSSLLM